MSFNTTSSLACVLVSMAMNSVSADVLNGGFEQPNNGFQTVNTGETLADWTNAGPGNIEFVLAEVRPALPGLEFSAYEGLYLIDLVGTQTPSAIFQDIPSLVPGGHYQIDWAQSGNVWGSDFAFTMEVVWNGTIVASNTQIHGGNNGVNMNWQERSITVIAAEGINRLMFRATTGANSRGPVLDAVQLSLVACLADINGDGELDFFDISAFLTAFSSLDPVADITGDGEFDFFDISAFLVAFAKGCP